MMKNLKRNWLVISKLTQRIWRILTWELKSLKNLLFNGLILTNYMFELKKYRGVMFDCTQDWYKVWRKTGLCFQKLTWGIFTTALESLQIRTLMASFCLKLKMYELKIYRGVICYDIEEWFTIEEELTCQFKIDMRNMTNFVQSTQKSQKFAL